MSASNTATYSGNSNYFHNLANAALDFVAALFAIRPASSSVMTAMADEAQARRSEKARAADIAKLYRLAAGYDSISPSLAAELRHLAGRDGASW